MLLIDPQVAQALAREGERPALVFEDDKLEIMWPQGTRITVTPDGNDLAFTIDA